MNLERVEHHGIEQSHFELSKGLRLTLFVSASGQLLSQLEVGVGLSRCVLLTVNELVEVGENANPMTHDWA